MNNILYIAMLSKIQKELNQNKEEIEKINEKFDSERINIEKFIKIIEYYKAEEKINKNKKIYIFCNGNPYIVLNLAIISIINNLDIGINVNENNLAVNKIILKIINDIIVDNKLNVKIELSEKVKDYEKVIFIDRINDFNIMKIKNSVYMPYESIDMYLDSENLEELYEIIYKYAEKLNIDVDIFDDESIENLLKYGKGKKKVILTQDKNIMEKYKGENIFINENPFKDEQIIFDKKMIEEIVE